MVFNDIDFSSLAEFEQDPLVLVKAAQAAQDRDVPRVFAGVVPPPPPLNGVVPPPPPMKQNGIMNGSMSMSTTELKGAHFFDDKIIKVFKVALSGCTGKRHRQKYRLQYLS